MQVAFSFKFMPLFNGTTVTKKLRNIVDTFFEKTLKNEQKLYPSGYSYRTTDIETMCKKVFQLLLQDAFSSSKLFSYIKMEKKLVLLILKSKFE